jgi:hypothetical protein
MTSFGGGLVPPVVPTVFVGDGRLGDLLVNCIVQASDVDSVELTAEFFHVSAAEGFYASAAAETVVYGIAAELVVHQSVLSLQ